MGRELNEYNWHVEWRNPTDLIPYDGNAKNHDGRNIANIAASIKKYGWQSYLVVTKGGIIIIGHGRRLAAIELGCRCPCKVIEDDLTDAEIRELRNVDNLTQDGDYDMAKLRMDLDDMELDFSEFDFEIDNYLDEDEPNNEEDAETENKGSLKDRYLVPPFSVIYGNKPDWLKRKRGWVNFGIRSEIGRGGGLAYNSRSNPAANFLPKSGGGNAPKPSRTTQD